MLGRTLAVAVSAALAVGLVGPLAAPTAEAGGPLVCAEVAPPWDKVPDQARDEAQDAYEELPTDKVPSTHCVTQCDAVKVYNTARGAHEETREALPAIFCAY